MIKKVNWTTNDNSVRLSVPISKVNVEKRTVSGFASLDNIDSHGDVVEAEASRAAFATFRGNLREMHQHVAVGKVVDISERTYFDPETEKFYQGVYVTARVSKGAEDTWLKVLDETLTGFSIGGDIIEAQPDVDPETNQPIRRIKKYSLHELSLVDNPANQFANVVSFEKVNDGLVAKGMVAETSSENVFYCADDHIALAFSAEEKDCEVCDTPMEKIGWFEYADESAKNDAVADAVKKFLAKDEGGVNMPEEIKKEAVESTETTETAATEEAPTAEVVEEPATEEAVAQEETVTEVEEPDFEKALSETRELAKSLQKTLDALDGSHKETTEKVDSITNQVESLSKTVTEKFEQFEQQVKDLAEQNGEIVKKFNEVNDDFKKLNDEVATVQQATAVKKSADLGGSGESLRKSEGSTWNGVFLDVHTDV